MKDPLDQAIASLDRLREEEQRLEARLAQIKAVLSGYSNGHVRLENARHKRPRNNMSLREAVLQVTQKRALTKAEILNEVGQLGYKFASPKPSGPLNALLYGPDGKKHFNNVGGKFRAK